VNLKRTILYLCALMPATGATIAQSFPSKPIRLVVGSVPGGGNDLVGRILAAKLTENLGQQVVVDNRGGANGIIGMELAARAAPDGYTFYMGTAGHLSVNPALYPEMPFNIGRDFTPLTQVVSLPFLIYQHPSLPGKTLRSIVGLDRAVKRVCVRTRPVKICPGAVSRDVYVHSSLRRLGTSMTIASMIIMAATA